MRFQRDYTFAMWMADFGCVDMYVILPIGFQGMTYSLLKKGTFNNSDLSNGHRGVLLRIASCHIVRTRIKAKLQKSCGLALINNPLSPGHVLQKLDHQGKQNGGQKTCGYQ